MTPANPKLPEDSWDVRGRMDIVESGAFVRRRAARDAPLVWRRTHLRGIRRPKACH
jgi:hypothetical protein